MEQVRGVTGVSARHMVGMYIDETTKLAALFTVWNVSIGQWAPPFQEHNFSNGAETTV